MRHCSWSVTKMTAGTVNVKVVDEAMERAVVLAARDIASSPLSDSEKYRQLVDLYKRHPILGSRTSTSSIEQAFSTPAPLAFIASRAAKVKAGDIVYDSAAGNGVLLIEAELDKAFANEINDNRNKSLQELGVGTVTKQDANEIEKSEPVDKVIINPPFGKLKEGIAQRKQSWTQDGVTPMERDHSISLRTLKSLKPNGKAVLIIGAKGIKNIGNDNERAKGYRNKGVIKFYDKLYDSFNVTDHYTVDGSLYAKQGASFPVDVIVIDGKGKSKRPKPYNVVGGGVPQLIKDWETLENEKLNKTPKLAGKGKAESLESDQPQLDSDSRGDSRGDERTDDGGLPIPDEKKDGMDGGSGRKSTPDIGGRDEREDVDSRGDVSSELGDGSEQVSEGTPDGRIGGEDGGVSGKGKKQTGTNRGDTADRSKKLDAKPNKELNETEFQKSNIPTSKAPLTLGTLVPANHVDAIKRAMDNIEAEHGQIDEFVAKELNWTVKEMWTYLAAEQVDAVAMAIHNHKNGSAFILGDQTGIGKGRVVASMIRYAIINGYVPVFMTQKPTLFDDMLKPNRWNHSS